MLIFSALPLASFVVTAAGRATYPFELEWMEGGSLDHVRWLVSGQRLYGPPGLAHIPFIYTPLYYYVAAALSCVFAPSLLLLRALSITFTGATALVLYLQLLHETRDRFAAWLGAALYVGTFRLSGYWFDIGRVDAACMFWLSLALYLARCKRTDSSAALAALALSLAFLTKQVALAAAVPLGWYLLCTQRSRAVAFTLGLLAAAGGGFLVLNWLHDGWLAYYTLRLPAQHALVWELLPDFWRKDLRRLAPAGLLLMLCAWHNRKRPAALLAFYAPLTATLFAVSWAARVHDGGAQNAIMPALLATSLAFGLAMHHGLVASPDQDPPVLQPLAVYTLALIQFVALLFAPWQQLPSDADRRTAEDFIARLRAVPADVYVIDHGYYAALAGKRTFAQGMAVTDVIRGDTGPIGRALADEIHRAIATKQFGAVVVGTVVPDVVEPQRTRAIHLSSWPPGLVEALERYYVPTMVLYANTRAFTPRVGWPRRPCVIYTPKP